jgi:DNA-directed RNA polymerase specialized sigma24 family protein
MTNELDNPDDAAGAAPVAQDGAGQVSSAVLFAALLQFLSRQGERGETVYERLRARLIAFLRMHLPAQADELADLTLDRLARRIHGGTAIQNVHSYALGIARLVLLEARARFQRDRSGFEEAAYLQQTEAGAVDTLNPDREALDREAIDAALSGCLERLGSAASALILEYYANSGATRIEARRLLAERLGLSINALRNRALRLRAALETCVREKLGPRDESAVRNTSVKSSEDSGR